MPNPPKGPITPIPDRQSVSTFNFDYLLHEGKIYTRTRTPDDPKVIAQGNLVAVEKTPDVLEWNLHDSFGIPFSKKMKPLLAPDEHIVEIDVASEIIVAVSNLNYVYLYKPTELTRPTFWEDSIGAPDFLSAKLLLPPNRRGWAFSCSVCTKPEVRTTEFMHPNEIVKYFSDGNQDSPVNFDFGFTPTIYVLNADGTKIVYWDTGLPPSFSRGFLVPEDTQVLFISAAGSTIFLCAIDAEEKLHYFTRMLDYEINGSCPGLKVSYSEIPLEYPPEGPNSSFFLGHGTRKMPLSGWIEHSVDAILPQLTHKICIRLTGQGNPMRELRIQGKDSELGWGYYSKAITDKQWEFNPDPTAAPTDHMKDEALSFNALLPKLKKTYTGTFYKNKFFQLTNTPLSKVTMELTDFHPFISDADAVYLVISASNEEPQPIRIYMGDAWGLHCNKYDEELFGTPDGEFKPLIGTVVLTSEQIEFAEQGESYLADFIKKYILPYNNKTKAITAIADNNTVNLRFGQHRYCFKRTLSEEEINDSFYIKEAMNPQLLITPKTSEEYEDLIAKNKECLKKIKSIFLKRQLVNSKEAVVNLNAELIRPSIAGVFKMARLSDPTYEQAASDLKTLFKVDKKAAAHSVKKGKTQGYTKAVNILDLRIKNLREAFEQTRSSAAITL